MDEETDSNEGYTEVRRKGSKEGKKEGVMGIRRK